MIEEIKGFFATPFNKYLFIALLLVGGFLLFQGDQQDTYTGEAKLTIDYFYLPTCPHCAEQKKLNAEITEKYPEIKIIQHNVENENELALLRKKLIEKGYTGSPGVPATFFGDKYFVGYQTRETTGNEIMTAVEETLAGIKSETPEPPAEIEAQSEENNLAEMDLPFLGKTNLKEFSLPVLAIVLGLIDGFNPCAMWVLVYLIALVMGLKDKRKLWFIVGSFVLASGILYFLFMTAWLNAFLLIGIYRPVTIIIGLVALGAGILSLKEYIESKGNIECKVSGAEDKKSMMSKMKAIVASPLNLATMGAIVVLAFVVNSIEFVCSSAIPAVFTQILALSNLGFFEHYGYIALYTFFFMFDDLIIFGLAAFTIDSEIGQKYAKHSKIIGGAIMLILGIILLFMPQYLA